MPSILLVKDNFDAPCMARAEFENKLGNSFYSNLDMNQINLTFISYLSFLISIVKVNFDTP